MEALIDRYLAGEHERVWSELVAAGSAVRAEPLRAMAEAVAWETMRRARTNIEMLIPRLHYLGYHFGRAAVDRFYEGGADTDEWDNDPRPFQPPLPERGALLDKLEAIVGPLPLALVAWYDVVGTVSLIGAHPDWQRSDRTMMPDPLMVYPLDVVVEDARERLADPNWIELNEPAYLYLAPDEYHKENISGGPPYSLLVQPAADAPFLFEWHNTTFVDYLRQAFRWGGFPGFARYERRPADVLAYLCEGLLPL